MKRYSEEYIKRRSRLTPVRFIEVKKDSKKSKKRKQMWLYKCRCGNETIKQKTKVKNGYILSCGCLKLETQRKNFALGRRKGKALGAFFQKGHKVNVGRKLNRTAPAHNKGKIAIYEFPNRPLTGKKKFVTNDELLKIFTGEIICDWSQ